MHLSLSDLLTCPTCGPGHGLVLLPDAVRERRVLEGVLGCPNCLARYRIRSGVAELGPGAEPAEREARPSADRSGEAGAAAEAGALRVGGLLGLAGVSGVVVLVGPATGCAGSLARLLDGVEVVVAGSSVPESEAAGWSVLRVSGALPLRSGSVSGVALTGDPGPWLESAARVVRPAARILVEPADEDTRERASRLGLRVEAESEGTMVLVRTR